MIQYAASTAYLLQNAVGESCCFHVYFFLLCRCACGSGGSLNAAALLTLAGRRCKPVIPQLNLTRASEGKPG